MIRGEEGFSYQNTFKPYEGMVSEIVIANKKNDQL
jgi:hypothetical protein